MTQHMRAIFSAYHPTVWWIIGATITTRTSTSMVMPFMALYMAFHTNASPSIIGLAVGMSALASIVSGFLCGVLADKFGRKRMMIVALIIGIVVMAGFANARTLPLFFILSGLNGLASTLFEPASQAMLTDITTDAQRAGVFGLRYWAINVGAAIGPLLGGYLGTVNTGATFYITAFVNLVYLIIIIFVFPESNLTDRSVKNSFHFLSAFRLVATDKAFLLFLTASLLSNVGYSQLQTTLPQFMDTFLNSHIAAKVYATVLTLNAVQVVVLQLPLTSITKSLRSTRLMMMGQFLFSLGYLSFAFARSAWALFFAIFVASMGEIILFPRTSDYVATLSGNQLRSTYFGAYSLRQIGYFLGPWVGGIVLENSGGKDLFLLVSVLVAAGIPFYALSNRVHQIRKAAQSTLAN